MKNSRRLVCYFFSIWWGLTPIICRALPPGGSAATPSGPPDPAAIAIITPSLEIWRTSTDNVPVVVGNPQIPKRHGQQLELGYAISCNQTTPRYSLIRLVFDSQAAGKWVGITASDGITMTQGAPAMQIDSAGGCTIAIWLDESFENANLVFDCEGIVTRLTLAPASSSFIAAHEVAP